jgi:hypothetical protein
MAQAEAIVEANCADVIQTIAFTSAPKSLAGDTVH